jgi:hypothetical protein
MGTSASSLKAAHRPLTVISPVSDWRSQDRTDDEVKNDDMDSFNHPRLRRLLILQSIMSERGHVEYVCSEPSDDGLDVYKTTHSDGLLQFLDSAWSAWADLGEEGRDPSGWSPEFKGDASAQIPPLVPTVVPFHRAANRQRPSAHVLGQVGYYCTDTVTPVFADLQSELHKDAGVVKRVLELLVPSSASLPPAGEEENEAVEAAPDEPSEQSAERSEPAIEDQGETGEGQADSSAEERNPTTVEPDVAPESEADPVPESALAQVEAPAAPSHTATSSHHDGVHPSQVVYALTTHPGTHPIAKLLQRTRLSGVALLTAHILPPFSFYLLFF